MSVEKRRAEAVRQLVNNVVDYQATVADCLLWFDGFNAAFPADRTCYTPHREKLVQLNAALQAIMPTSNSVGQEIPF